MKKRIAAFLLAMAALPLWAQQKPYTARVFDGITFMPLSDVSVYNMSARVFAFTGDDGTFTIPLSLNDTLVFSKSAYRQAVVPVDKRVFADFDDFFLYYKVTMLREVTIFGLNPSYEGFKRDIVTLRLPEYYARLEQAKLSEFDKANAAFNSKGNLLGIGGAAVMSPLSYLYDTYSHKGKMRRLYGEMASCREEADRIQDKYNRDIVTGLTGLTGETLIEFMMFCRFSYYDLVRMSDEEIRGRIRAKYADYQYYKMHDGQK